MRTQEYKDEYGWIYRTENGNDFSVIPNPSEQYRYPEYLYKYFSLTDNSISALDNEYLFASDRWLLNDPYDCHSNIIDWDGFDFEQKVKLSEVYRKFIKENANGNSELLEMIDRPFKDFNRELKELVVRHYYLQIVSIFCSEFYKNYGIISLTTNNNSLLMWAHYSNNEGFLLEYDYSKFSFENSKPFPINYVDENSLPQFKDESLSVLMFLFQCLQKSRVWSYENEWRIIPRKNENMKISRSGEKLDSRRFSVGGAVKSITLGSRFFCVDKIKVIRKGVYGGYWRLNETCEKRLKVLNKIIKSNFKTYWVVDPDNFSVYYKHHPKKNSYNLHIVELEISRVENEENVFEIHHILKPE